MENLIYTFAYLKAFEKVERTSPCVWFPVLFTQDHDAFRPAAHENTSEVLVSEELPFANI